MQFERFGKYLLLEKLASGGMAEVYLAKLSSGINKFVALKRILSQFSANSEFIDMFKEEAKIAANLRHSNIVSIHFFGHEKKQLFLVMDFVEGQNLRQLLNVLKRENRELSIDQVIYIVKEVAAGLDYAHRALDDTTGRPLNIIHRDMSPQNIMVSFDGEVKIVDFGIAKAENQVEQTQAGTIKGKFSYMSPEQSEGTELDARTDVFSLGIILWELLAKERLFVGTNDAMTLKKVRDCQIPSLRKINPNIPAELERIAMKTLSKDLSLRYQSASSLHKDLNRFLNIHYPEFSKQEFSKFMKSLFHDMFIENRRKLAEYSQVPFTVEGSGNGEHTQTSTATATVTETSSSADENEFIPGLDLHEKSAGINLKELKVEGKANPLPSMPQFAHKSSQPMGTQTGQKPSSFASPGTGISAKTSTSASTSYNPLATGSSSHFSIQNMMVAAGLAIIAYVGWYFWGKDSLVTTSPITQAPAKTEQPGEVEQSSLALSPAPINIQSRPSGAIIEVDGRQIGITPFLGTLPSGKPLRILLKKDGFIHFEKSETLKPGEPFRLEATLQPEPPKGYISVEVFGAPADTVITVNGQRIEDKSQLNLYAVPANVPIVIRAHSPFSNSAAQSTVTVDANQRRSIRLVMARQAQ